MVYLPRLLDHRWNVKYMSSILHMKKWKKQDNKNFSHYFTVTIGGVSICKVPVSLSKP